MAKPGLGKKIDYYANNKIEFCVYTLRNKVEEAIQKDIYYANIGDMDVASWKFIDCLVENKVKKVQLYFNFTLWNTVSGL